MLHRWRDIQGSSSFGENCTIGLDMTIRHYIAKNEIMREVLGMPRA
jgi:hypothetical protein